MNQFTRMNQTFQNYFIYERNRVRGSEGSICCCWNNWLSAQNHTDSSLSDGQFRCCVEILTLRVTLESPRHHIQKSFSISCILKKAISLSTEQIPLKELHDGSCLFKDAVFAVFFWMQAIILSLGWAQSLSALFCLRPS